MLDSRDDDKGKSSILTVLAILTAVLHLVLSLRGILIVSRTQVNSTVKSFHISIVSTTILVGFISATAWASNARVKGAAVPLFVSSTLGVLICLILFGV